MTRSHCVAQLVHVVLLLPWFTAAGLPAAEPVTNNQPQAASPVAKSTWLRIPVSRDTWFSTVGSEADGNTGGSSRLKVKSFQEMSLLDFDPKPLRGRKVEAAILHFRLATNVRLHRITASTFSSAWVEGTGQSYDKQEGSSTFHRQQHPSSPWAYPGSDMTAVMLGQGGSFWRMADASPPLDPPWQNVPVDPRVVAARVAGISHGLLIFDDTGSEWTRRGEKWTQRLFPNRFLHSREAGADHAPRLSVLVGPSDDQPPPAPGALEIDAVDLPAGEALVRWETPADRGPSGTVGFFVEVNGQAAPRYLIPAAGEPHEVVEMHVRDLALAPGDPVEIAVRAVDGAGNRSDSSLLRGEVSSLLPHELPGNFPPLLPADGPLPKLADAEVAVVDPLDKIEPQSGRLIPERDKDYLHGNHLWSARRQHIRLASARNEFVAFQIALSRPIEGLKVDLRWKNPKSGLVARWFQYHQVPVDESRLPDPLIPLADGKARGPAPTVPAQARGGEASADRAGIEQTPDTQDEDTDRRGANWNSLLCDVYVPHDAESGAHRATVTLSTGQQRLEIDVVCWVWDFTLPDHLSFLPEMNCYGLPENERDYYRLAHEHRTVLNRVPYHHNGHVQPGCAPELDGKRLDWQAWDARFGPYLDGTAFDGLPRDGVPLECFYLPLHENWPGKMSLYYRDHYWADSTFRPGYRELFVDVAAQFARHFLEKGWNQTLFQFYLNNKVDYKRNGWSRATSPWLLDEPANYQDFWALRYFGEAFHEGVRLALAGTPNPPRLVFRADISRPQWQRDTLDHVLDYNVVAGGAFRQYRRMVLDRKRRHRQIVVDYGGVNDIRLSNMQPVGWCLDSWTLGSDGVVPWQTIGSEASWNKAEATALFYPGPPVATAGPVPSIRLKAFRRGQQDVEYLVLLSQLTEQPRWAIGSKIREVLHLMGTRESTGAADAEDAGRISFRDLLPEDVWALRIRVARVLDSLGPKPKSRLVEFHPPVRDPRSGAVAYARLPEGWAFATTAASQSGEATRRQPPTHQRHPTGQTQRAGHGPTTKTDRPMPGRETGRRERSGKLVRRVLQSRQAVCDAIIDPEAPDQNFGRVPEDNRLRRRNQVGVLLMKFDLSKIDLPRHPDVVRARLSFYVWDPCNSAFMAVAAHPLKTDWDEYEATWNKPAKKGQWKGGEHFSLADDAGARGEPVIIAPNSERDVVHPPVEYRLDITEEVRAWLSHATPNYGVAIAPLLDSSVDDGHFSRIQIVGAESRRERYVPKLEIELRERTAAPNR